MKYTLTCCDRSYVVESAFEVGLDTIWAYQRNFFLTGSKVIIQDENGNVKEFYK